MNNIISENMITYDPVSQIDTFGKVFYYQNEIYRAIAPDSEAVCRTILAKSRKWEKHGLVKTRKAPISLKSSPLTVWHEKVKYKNYCAEWLPVMFKDAALQFLKLNIRLLKDGFICKDAHPWNIFFNFSKPVFIDIGSIVPYEKKIFRWHILEFKLYFLLPLLLFKKEGIEKTYEFLRQPIPNTEYRKIVASNTLDENLFKGVDLSKPHKVLKHLFRYIKNIELDIKLDTKWSAYDQKEISFKKPHKFLPKQKAVYNLLADLPTGNVLDIGCNSGWFSILAERMGHEIVSIDSDVPSISRLYHNARKKELSVLTLYINFKDPTPAHGLHNAYPSFEERFSFDIVLAMAFIHHLAYFSKMSFDEIAERISRLNKKYLIVEFIPKEDSYVKKWDQSEMKWYTRQNFIQTFLKYFKDYKAFKSSPDPREVFIFSK